MADEREMMGQELWRWGHDPQNWPVPDLEPAPVTHDQWYALTPEKLELVYGFLINGPEKSLAREKLLSLLLTNVGLVRAVQLAPAERWREALERAYPDAEE